MKTIRPVKKDEVMTNSTIIKVIFHKKQNDNVLGVPTTARCPRSVACTSTPFGS